MDDSEILNKDILVIDKSDITTKLIIDKIENDLGFGYKYCKNFEETKEYLDAHPNECFISIFDINIDESNDEGFINYIVSKGIPVIATASSHNDNMKEKILNKNIVDYYIKKDYRYIDQLIKMIKNLLCFC